MGAQTPAKKQPINCPYCDEPAYQKHFANRVVSAHKIFTKRECPLGHTFITIECAPENQDAAEQEMRYFARHKKEEYGNL